MLLDSQKSKVTKIIGLTTIYRKYGVRTRVDSIAEAKILV